VIPQALRLTEVKPTRHAAVGSLSGMLALVPISGHLVRETLITERASVRLFSRVGPRMYPQGAGLSERFRANLADVRLLSRVDPRMSPQGARIAEGSLTSAADVAHEGDIWRGPVSVAVRTEWRQRPKQLRPTDRARACRHQHRRQMGSTTRAGQQPQPQRGPQHLTGPGLLVWDRPSKSRRAPSRQQIGQDKRRPIFERCRPTSWSAIMEQGYAVGPNGLV
jgi:hypothetical protein